MNQWDEPKFDQRVKVVLPSGAPARNCRYEYVHADGAKVQGVTDGEGWATVQMELGIDELGIRLLGKVGSKA